jgi:uncharacterized protein YndB with AHSA1/START domain
LNVVRKVMRRLILLCGLSFVFGSGAIARELGPEDAARLAQGEVMVELSPDRDPAKRIWAERVWAAEDIDAPPETVWAVMTDCGEALRYVPRLKACEVVEADPAGRWDVRRHELSSFPALRDVQATFRLEYERPLSMRFQQIAGDMSGSQGEWRLEALDGGRRTRVVYDARLPLPSGLPGLLALAVMRADAPAAMEGLRQRSLEAAARAGAGKPPVS